MSLLISFTIFITGIVFNAVVVSMVMIIFEIIFSLWLIPEIRTLNKD